MLNITNFYSYFDKFFRFPDEKLHSADTRQELQLLLRQIGCQKRRSVGFRDSRFYLLAENVDYVPSEAVSTFAIILSLNVFRIYINTALFVIGFRQWDSKSIWICTWPTFKC